MSADKHTLVLPFYFDAFPGQDVRPKLGADGVTITPGLQLWTGPPLGMEEPLESGQPPYPPPPGLKRYGFRLVLKDWRQPEPSGEQDLGELEVKELQHAAQGEEEGEQGHQPGELERSLAAGNQDGAPSSEEAGQEEDDQAQGKRSKANKAARP